MEKPTFILIGEAHAQEIEDELIFEGKIKTKIKTTKGRKRLIVDISADKGKTRESLKRIIDGVIKREVEILKKKGITRLLYEEEDTKEKKAIYSRFRQKKDLKRLKSELRKENRKIFAQELEIAKEFLKEMKAWKPVQDGFNAHLQELEKEKVSPIFSLSYVNVAHKAGIYDIVPIEDRDCYIRTGGLLIIWNSARYVEARLNQLYSKADIDEMERAAVMDSVRRAINEVLRSVRNKSSELSKEREKRVCRKIREKYAPNSALICGMAHVEHLKRLLSKEFDVKIYEVGKEFL